MTEYVPPKVWVWNKPNGGTFANINRPIAGPTHEKELPVGRHPLQLYSLATPNGQKATIMLEELLALGHKGAEYDAWLIKINDGRSVQQRLRQGESELRRFRRCSIAAARSRSGYSSRARFSCTSPRSSARSCRRSSAARRDLVVAVLADGRGAVSRRRLRPLLYVCADQDRIRDRPVHHGSEGQQLDVLDRRLGESEVHRGQRVHDCRYGDRAWYGQIVEGPGATAIRLSS